MTLAFPLLIAATAAAPHSGAVSARTAPELSDIALFLMAAGGIWLVRRALRARFAKQRVEQAREGDPHA
ncbi:MAG: hypothetical protein ACKVOB_03270 [Sphingomonas sp.]